jgi:hypothetical protein
VPTQLANADKHAERRGWRVAARFKDDGYFAFKEINRDDFVNCPPYPIHPPWPGSDPLVHPDAGAWFTPVG